MKIGIIGTGMVGQALAAKLSELGHDVVIGTRDVSATLARTSPDGYGNPPYRTWQAQHPKIRLATFAEAAAHAEIVINATSGGISVAALTQAGEENLNGKILIDIANPLDFSKGMPPSLSVCNTDSLSEQIQRAFPRVKVVKTLNTVNATVMVDPVRLAGAELAPCYDPHSHIVYAAGREHVSHVWVNGELVVDNGNLTTIDTNDVLARAAFWRERIVPK